MHFFVLFFTVFVAFTPILCEGALGIHSQLGSISSIRNKRQASPMFVNRNPASPLKIRLYNVRDPVVVKIKRRNERPTKPHVEMYPGTFKTEVINYPPDLFANRLKALIELKQKKEAAERKDAEKAAKKIHDI